MKHTFYTLLLLFFLIMPACAIVTIPAGSINNYNMNTANETYVLAGNVVAGTTALTAGANNITLDGMGHNIAFGTTGAGYAVYSQGKNEIRLMNFTAHANATYSNCYGLYIYSCTGANITNVDVSTNGSSAIYLRSATGNTLSNSTFTSTTGIASYNNLAANNAFYNCEISTGSNYAVYDQSSDKSAYELCTITSETSSAIQLPATSTNFTIEGCTVQSSATSKPAINMLDAYMANILNSTIITNSNIGLYVTRTTAGSIGTRLCNIKNNTIIASGSNPALYVYGGRNNTISDNMCTGNTGNGAYFREAHNNTMNGNNYHSETNDGLLVAYKTYNNEFDNETCSSNGTMGIFVYNASGNDFSNMTIVGDYASAPHTGTHVLMVGDSITEGGQGGTQYSQLQSLLANMVSPKGWNVSNQGFSGERANYGRERFTQELDIFEPTMVTIMYGTNDLIDDRPQQDIIDDILWMANTSKNRNITPYVMLTPCIYTNNTKRIWLDQNLSAQAKANGFSVINVYDSVDTVPNNTLFDGYNSSNFADGIHPNTAGNQLIANRMYLYIAPKLDWVNDWRTSNGSRRIDTKFSTLDARSNTTLPYYVGFIQNTSSIALDSNNTNASVYWDDNNILISTGVLKEGDYFYYNVSMTQDPDTFINPWLYPGLSLIGTTGVFVIVSFINRRRRQ